MATPPRTDPFYEHLELLGLPWKASYLPDEAARVLGCSTRTIYRLIEEGALDWVDLRSTRRPLLGALRARFHFHEEELSC